MSDDTRAVVVTDIRIPFTSMVTLMVKWAIAAIPALFILFFIGGVATLLAGMLFGTGWHHWSIGGRGI